MITLRFSLTLAALAFSSSALFAEAPLPSWNDGPNKKAIIDFVAEVTDPDSESFVPPAERLAVFDNDGTLWAEKPVYFQLLYAIDRVKELAPDHPEWKTTQPFQAVLEGDMESLKKSGEKGILQLIMATHAGLSTDEFNQAVRAWMDSAIHPEKKVSYLALIYQPMLELMEYLRANEFEVFIVSGGGIDFIRVVSEELYGIPPQNVVGSSIAAEYKVVDGQPTITKLPKINFIDDKEGKPVGLHQHLGRRPILAGGNSDGDFQMLEWSTAGDGKRLGLLIHHDDADGEWAYDRETHVGKLDRGLDEAKERGWLLVSMKDDWNTVFPSRN